MVESSLLLHQRLWFSCTKIYWEWLYASPEISGTTDKLSTKAEGVSAEPMKIVSGEVGGG